MNKTPLATLVFLTLCLKASASVEIRSEQITIADGLANNTVRHIMQDSKGFIWMGTLNGLTRYDGNSFLSYYPSPDAPLSLTDRKIYSLKEGRNGHLWICFSSEQYSCFDLKRACFVDFTGRGELHEKYSKDLIASNGDVWLWHNRNGARRITGTDGVFRSVSFKKEHGNLPDNTVNFVGEGIGGSCWIGTGSGLVLVKADTEVSVIDHTEDFNSMLIYGGNTYFLTNDGKTCLYDTAASKLVWLARLPWGDTPVSITGNLVHGGTWMIFTSGGVYGYDFKTKEAKPLPGAFGENILSANVLEDNKGNCWIYNHTGRVWYLNVQTGEQKKFALIPTEKMGYIDLERYQVVHDSHGIIWISTYGNGLFAYDTAKDELSHFNAGMGGPNHISSDYLLGVMEDRSGEIWVSAEFSGISRLSIINSGSYRYFPEDQSLLDRSNTIRLACRINDEIWVGTRKGGLYVYNSDFRLLKSTKDMHANVYAVRKDASGKTWMGTRGNGLCIDNVWYRNDPDDPSSLGNNNIFCVFEDSRSRMWVGTFNGGLSLAREEEGRYTFRHFLNRTYNQRQIRTICEDRNGMIWVGTSEGIYIFDPDSLISSPENYYHYDYASGKLGSNEIKYIFRDSKGNMWVSTSGAGFCLCGNFDDYGALVFEQYSTEDGLCNDIVQSVAEDRWGNIWLATEYGISKFAPSRKAFENYYLSAYSQGNVYTESSVCELPDGHILFGSNYGFVVFDPAEVRKQSYTSPVVFTHLSINGSGMLPGDAGSPLNYSLAYTDGIRLKHNRNSVQVDFSSFNYADGGQTKYSYMLANYDKDWSVPSTLSFAAYKMLPPGRYELLVKSGDSSGVFNAGVSSLKIVITPPFYLTIWAFLIYAAVLCMAMFFVVRITRNFNRLNNKIAVEKQLTEYKLVFFTNISHEFRTPLTLINGAMERIRRLDMTSGELSSPLRIMEKNISRLLRLIDQLLEFRKMQNNKLALSLEKTDVIAMLYEIFLSFGDMAESKNMDFRFVPSATSLTMFVDKGKLDKITYNLLSNAFKYTPQKGKICLSVAEDTRHGLLEIQVTDTGVGIPKEKRSELFNRFMQSNFSGESVGIGLHLTLEQVQVHKGEISYDENPGGGSVFTVKLPMDPRVYEEKDFLIPNNALMQERKQPFVSNDIIQPAADSVIIKPNPLNKQKILVVEDEADIRQYLKEELGMYFHVEAADNGDTGFQAAQECAPDLIVCDVLMPGMNGYELTRKLKGEFATSHIPVILLTALNLPENHLEGIESGADAYLSKPFSVRLLLTRVVKLLEQREKLKEKFSEEPGIRCTAIFASARDKEFVDELHRALTENMGNPGFSVDEFASLMNVGRTVFYKKVKGVTGYSPNEYIRIMRMKKAAELLLTGKFSVSEVSYQVGINDPFYFSKCFKAQFGVAPSVFLRGRAE